MLSIINNQEIIEWLVFLFVVVCFKKDFLLDFSTALCQPGQCSMRESDGQSLFLVEAMDGVQPNVVYVHPENVSL